MPGWLPASVTRSLFLGSSAWRRPKDSRQEETLIFVDVDGVLNVGVRIKGEAPINLTDANYDRALALEGQQNFHAERILAATRRQLDHGDSTYAKLVSQTPFDVSEVLVHRLAELISTAGERCTVVLSSSWRKPQHQKRARRLEERLSAHLGYHFSFHDSTPLRSENGAEDRLWTIGRYLADLADSRQQPAQSLRVLVLEDFCINPLRGMAVRKCGTSDEHPSSPDEAQTVEIDSALDAERYLRTCAAGNAADVRVKVAHTYDSWISPEGFSMEVGSGLTMDHFCGALTFLGGRCEHCARTGPSGCRRSLGEERGEEAATAPRARGDEPRREERKCGREARDQDERSGCDGKRYDELTSKPDLCIPGQA